MSIPRAESLKAGVVRLLLVFACVTFWAQLAYWSLYSGLLWQVGQSELRERPIYSMVTPLMEHREDGTHSILVVGTKSFVDSMRPVLGREKSILEIELARPELQDVINLLMVYRGPAVQRYVLQSMPYFWSNQRRVFPEQNLELWKAFHSKARLQLVPIRSAHLLFSVLKDIVTRPVKNTEGDEGEETGSIDPVEVPNTLFHSKFMVPGSEGAAAMKRLKVEDPAIFSKVYWVGNPSDIPDDLEKMPGAEMRALFSHDHFINNVGNFVTIGSVLGGTKVFQ